jgi:hypothetical protein
VRRNSAKSGVFAAFFFPYFFVTLALALFLFLTLFASQNKLVCKRSIV